MSMPPAPPPPPPLGDDGVGSGVTSPRGESLASPGLRVLARFLDGLILFALAGVIDRIVVGDAADLSGLSADEDGWKLVLVLLLNVAMIFLWDAVATRIWGGTPMKLAFGMRVVRADNGEHVGWSHAIIRWAIPGAFVLIPFPALTFLAGLVVVIVSLVFIFTKPLRQAVWDQVAKTLVIKRAR